MIYRLFTTYYNEPRTPRRLEMDRVVIDNTAAFDVVYVLAERMEKPKTIPAAVVWKTQRDRQRFADLIAWAASESNADDLTVIANGDITIPRNTLEEISAAILPDEAYCLARWNVYEKSEPKLYDRDFTQDTWIVRGKPRRVGGDFIFGVPHCDNRIAWELERAGYRVSNPSRTFRTFHIHASRMRTPTNCRRFGAPRPYLYIAPSTLGEVPQLRRRIT